jgi:hypothetical protein
VIGGKGPWLRLFGPPLGGLMAQFDLQQFSLGCDESFTDGLN